MRNREESERGGERVRDREERVRERGIERDGERVRKKEEKK